MCVYVCVLVGGGYANEMSVSYHKASIVENEGHTWCLNCCVDKTDADSSH